MPYGMPSQYEKNLQRRESPGLTRVGGSSVSFCPLQGLFGVITPSGLHFERHHQGWWDMDPSKHRLMINGSDATMLKRPMVFSMDELMRLPSVSRMHFIECGANTGMEWGNVAVPTCQYTHGMLSCSEFTGVPLKILLDMAGCDYKRGRFVLGQGHRAAAKAVQNGIARMRYTARAGARHGVTHTFRSPPCRPQATLALETIPSSAATLPMVNAPKLSP